MKKSKAVELLKLKLAEIEALRQLLPRNQRYSLWKHEVVDIVGAACGTKSPEYARLMRPVSTLDFAITDEQRMAEYVEELDRYETDLMSLIGRMEMMESEIMLTPGSESPVAFIAHGGESPALTKLKAFLVALGVKPLVVEEQPSEGRSVAGNVDHYSKQADYAVILASKGDIDAATGGFMPRGNVLMETGKLQEIFGSRIVYLLQSGAKFPSNISEKVWERFTPQSMDKAFIKVALELRACGILSASRRRP